jgi:hypothetical protein
LRRLLSPPLHFLALLADEPLNFRFGGFDVHGRNSGATRRSSQQRSAAKTAGAPLLAKCCNTSTWKPHILLPHAPAYEAHRFDTLTARLSFPVVSPSSSCSVPRLRLVSERSRALFGFRVRFMLRVRPGARAEVAWMVRRSVSRRGEISGTKQSDEP